jgi:hypothetical protein
MGWPTALIILAILSLAAGAAVGLYFWLKDIGDYYNETPPPPSMPEPAPSHPTAPEATAPVEGSNIMPAEPQLPDASAPAEQVNLLDIKLHGCYADTQSRILAIHNPADMIKNAEECANFAKEKKAKFFGLQFANGRKDGRADCWVGNLPGDSIAGYLGGKLDDSNCGTYNESTVGLYGYTQSVYEVL